MASQLSQLSGCLERLGGDGGIWEEKKENEKLRQIDGQTRKGAKGGWLVVPMGIDAV